MAPLSRNGKPVKAGAKVRSLYRAPWIGTVLEVIVCGRGRDAYYNVVVRQEVDRHGLPIRLRKSVRLHPWWLEVI